MKKFLPVALFALFAFTASPALANGPSEKAIVVPVLAENTLSQEQLQQIKVLSENNQSVTPAEKHGLKKMISKHRSEDVHGGGYFYISGAGLILLIILLIILL